MHAVVVYESMFGSTHEVARAIAEGLGGDADVSLVPVAEASPESIGSAELLVVGGPTHMHGLASPRSREMAAKQAEKQGVELDEAGEGDGLRAWLEELPRVDGARGAAFDTRLRGWSVITGSAARGIERRLRGKGYELVAEPKSFIVTGEGAAGRRRARPRRRVGPGTGRGRDPGGGRAALA